MCTHGRQKHTCKECDGACFCKHGKQKSRCAECGGGNLCKHGLQKRTGARECAQCRAENVFLDAERLTDDNNDGGFGGPAPKKPRK